MAKPKVGVRQRALIALTIARGGYTLVEEFTNMSLDWEDNRALFISINSLVANGFMTCSDEVTALTSRVYVTPEGRKALNGSPLAVISKGIKEYSRNLFDVRSRRMMCDIEQRLAEGAKVCLVVKDIDRRNKVRRAVSYKLGDKALSVHVPSDAGFDWLRFEVPGHELFVEPYLLEQKLEKQLAYLERYRSSGKT